MPIYEFKCVNCGVILEKIMKTSDPSPLTSDCCAQGKLVKLISKTNFVLKGQGWYETDFKDKKSSRESTSKKDLNKSCADKNNKKSNLKSDKLSSTDTKQTIKKSKAVATN